MQLYCPDCGAAIPAADINVATRLAKCTACNSVFSFADRKADEPAEKPAGIFPQPPRMKVEERGGVMRISWRWFNWTYIPMLGFCIFWDAFYLPRTLVLVQQGPLLFELLWVLLIALGVSVTYNVLTGFFNYTLIDIDDLSLSIWHGPLPWWGNRRLPADRIDQLYCERIWSHSGEWTHISHRLSAAMREGNRLHLVCGLKHLAEAKFLEQQIEERLKIRPRPVVGECNE